MTAVARILEHRALQYRRTFRASLFGSFLSPVMFLAAMGIGLGAYVQTDGNAAFGGLTYLQFLAPGLLAASVMQSAAFEATFPVMGGLMWTRTFHGMYATPISPFQIAMGNLAWIAIRMTMIATVFTIVVVLFGAASSLQIILAIPAAVLTGMAFAAPVAAFAATQRTVNKFNAIFRFGVTPLFLLSGTFFPIASLPDAIQPLAWLSPLWHGVSLTRSLALGTIGDEPLLALAHIGILAALTVAGILWAARTFEARLVRG